MTPLPVHLDPASGLCVVNGVDLTDDVDGFSFTYERGRPTRVRLQLRAGVDLPMVCADCEVDVIMPGEVPDLNTVILSWLGMVDPGSLERDTLDRMGFDGRATMEVALEVLAGYAGAPS